MGSAGRGCGAHYTHCAPGVTWIVAQSKGPARLIDYLRGRNEAIDLFEVQETKLKVSVVSTTELYAGVRTRREEQKIELLLSQAALLPVTREIAARSGTFMRLYEASHNVEIADALVAATAEHHALRLATLNIKHFPMFPKLKPAY